MQVQISDYGGTVISLTAPDRDGRFADVVLGHDSIDAYAHSGSYFGALIGRCANRIAHGQFSLDGTTYHLACNDGAHHLHGGLRGFDKVQWTTEEATQRRLRLSYTSPDGEEGYPGDLDAEVTFELTDDNELNVEYAATADRATPVNLSHHGYFNLTGDVDADVLGHILMINADAFTPVDGGLIPTGEIRELTGTPLDFRAPTAIGARINDDDEQLRNGSGYDHNFIINGAAGTLKLAARVLEPRSGRVLEIFATQPGLQFYSGNFLDGAGIGKQGALYRKHSGFALETQYFPDSPNHPHFPDTVLRPGKEYRERAVYRFTTQSAW